MTRPGTIGWALGLSDQTHVYCDDVIVSKIQIRHRPRYWVCRETFDRDSALIIMGPPPVGPDGEQLALGQDICIEGNLTTLHNAYRGLTSVTAYAYLASADGPVLKLAPFMKGILGPDIWPWQLTMLSRVARISSAAGQSVSVLDDDGGDPGAPPGGYPNPDQDYTVVWCDTPQQARDNFDPNNRVMVELDAKALDNPQSSLFSLEQDDTAGNVIDAIDTYYSQSGSLDPTMRVNTMTGTIQADSTGYYWVEVDSAGIDFEQGDNVGNVQSVRNNESIGFARTYPLGTRVPLAPMECIANQEDFPGAIYVQEPAGSGNFGGARLIYSGSLVPARGALLDISGKTEVITSDGESVINVDSGGSIAIDSAGSDPLIMPIGLPQTMLGGGDFNKYVPGVIGGFGPYQKGVLTRIWGTVTAVDPVSGFFYVDDGAALSDSTGNGTGVEVAWGYPASSGEAPVPGPEVGWVVSVTGISSSDSAARGGYYRVLRPRDQNEITVYSSPPPRSWPSLAPGWANPAIPHDSPPVGACGPSSADSVDLATGAGENNPDPDICVNNAIGPDAEYARIYRSTLAQTGLCSPGLSPGWASNYDTTITGTQGSWSLTLHYPDGATEPLTPNLDSCGFPVVPFPACGRPYTATGVADSASGAWDWVKITYDDESTCTFAANTAYSPYVYLVTQITDADGHPIHVNRMSPTDIRLSSVTNSLGGTLLSFTYNGAVLSSVSDALGRTVNYGFNTQGVLNTVSQIGGSSSRWQYTYSTVGPSHLLTQVAAPNPTSTANPPPMIGHPIYYGMDGKVQAMQDANGNTHQVHVQPRDDPGHGE